MTGPAGDSASGTMTAWLGQLFRRVTPSVVWPLLIHSQASLAPAQPVPLTSLKMLDAVVGSFPLTLLQAFSGVLSYYSFVSVASPPLLLLRGALLLWTCPACLTDI